MPRHALAGVCIGALLLVGAGCGDDDDQLTEAEFLDQGNAICATGNEELDAAFEEAFPDQNVEPTPEEVGAVFLDEIIPNVQGQIDDIRALNAPDSLADDVDAVLDDAEAVLDELEEQADEDPEAILASEEDPFADVNPRLVEIGLTTCGQSD